MDELSVLADGLGKLVLLEVGVGDAELGEASDGCAGVVGVATLAAIPGALEDGLAGGTIAQ